MGFSDQLPEYEIAIRILVSILIGGIIGYEREYRKIPAGFRTHILVCLGATLISILQDQLRIYIMDYIKLFPDSGNVLKLDLGRLGAQVISGIGFLGAGSIMRDKGVTNGFTTAASIWVTGCLGLSIGWGFYKIAFIAMFSIILILVILKKFENFIYCAKSEIRLKITIKSDCNYNDSLAEILTTLKKIGAIVKGLNKNNNENSVEYSLTLNKKNEKDIIFEELSKYECIQKLDIL